MVKTLTALVALGGLGIVAYLLFFQKPSAAAESGAVPYGGALGGTGLEGAGITGTSIGEAISKAMGYPIRYSGEGANLGFMNYITSATAPKVTAPAQNYYGANNPTPAQGVATATNFLLTSGGANQSNQVNIAKALGVPTSYINPNVNTLATKSGTGIITSIPKPVTNASPNAIKVAQSYFLGGK